MPNVVQKVLSTIGKGLGQTTPYSLPKYSGREVIYNTTLVLLASRLRHTRVTPQSQAPSVSVPPVLINVTLSDRTTLNENQRRTGSFKT